MFWGSDTDAVRAHAVRTADGSAALEEMSGRLRSYVAAVAWEGPDAEEFRSLTESEGCVAIAGAAAMLTRFARDLEQEADAQDAASDPREASSGGADGVDRDENKFWFWQDGFAPFWGDTADLQNDIPLDGDQFTVDSINQEGTGNCVSLSVLAAIANADPEFLSDHVRRIGDEHYEVELFVDGAWRTVEVQGDVPRDGVRGPDGDQSWATIYEQALIQEGVLDENGEYSSNSQGASVFEAVTGGEFDYRRDGGNVQQTMPSYENVVEAAESGQPVVLCTENSEVSANGVEIVEQHAYTVERVNADGSLTLVNPWGSDANYDAEDGSHRITVTEEEYQQLFDGIVIGETPENWER